MEQQNVPSPVGKKSPYAPPKATFIPLKLEERLLVCGKVSNSCIGMQPTASS